MTYSKEELKRQVEAVLLPRVIEGLSKPLRVRETLPDAEAPSTREIVFSGSLDEVNEHFYRNFWSDGLPIIPPTLRRVERFMRFTDRGPEEVIGICPPANREATVWNVAVNGVMAGCRPEHMPILPAAGGAGGAPCHKSQDPR